jgi:tetratricopeptide (TPR) repeat protein
VISRRVGLLAILPTILAAQAVAPRANLGRDGLVEVPAEILERPLPLRDGIGAAHEPVTTSAPEAQAYYDQGIAYLHSYVWIEAARSFNQALRLDKSLAMAYLGLSYALEELGASEGAKRAGEHALALAGPATDREQLRIELRVKQLAAGAQPGDPALRADYFKRFDQALEKYPKDVELLLLRGHAHESPHQMPGMGGGEESLRFYQRALAESPHSFAAHHYLAHAYENIGAIDHALEHASEYARLAPAIPHAHHMLGHSLRRVNRMTDAITEFRRADELALAYFKAEKIAPEYDWQYHHNLDLLGTAYEYTGQMRSAEAVLRRSFELPPIERSEELNQSAWPLFLLAQGRAEEALAASRALIFRPDGLVRALGHLLASRVLITLHRMDDAAEEGDRALRQMRTAGTMGGVLVPELQVSQGEFLLQKSQAERGRTMLLDALAKLRADPGPDAWIQTLFTLQEGYRVARNAGESVLAAELAQQMRQFDSAYGGSHYAVAQAAERQGNLGIAKEEYTAALRAWRAADPDLADAADARRRLAAFDKSPVPGKGQPR